MFSTAGFATFQFSKFFFKCGELGFMFLKTLRGKTCAPREIFHSGNFLLKHSNSSLFVARATFGFVGIHVFLNPLCYSTTSLTVTTWEGAQITGPDARWRTPVGGKRFSIRCPVYFNITGFPPAGLQCSQLFFKFSQLGIMFAKPFGGKTCAAGKVFHARNFIFQFCNPCLIVARSWFCTSCVAFCHRNSHLESLYGRVFFKHTTVFQTDLILPEFHRLKRGCRHSRGTQCTTASFVGDFTQKFHLMAASNIVPGEACGRVTRQADLNTLACLNGNRFAIILGSQLGNASLTCAGCANLVQSNTGNNQSIARRVIRNASIHDVT